MLDLLVKYPEGELDAVWAGWDATAWGAFQATQEIGRDEVVVTGVDGQDFAIAEVAKGLNWIATVRQDWPTITATLADIIDDHFAGTDPAEPDVLLPGRWSPWRTRSSSARASRPPSCLPPGPDGGRSMSAEPRAAMTRAAALGFDVGTTSVKAGLLWLDSDEPMVVVSRAVSDVAASTRLGGAGPAGLGQRHGRVLGRPAGLVGDVELRSVGLCSQVNTHLFIDADGRPLRPAITWQDTGSRGRSRAGEGRFLLALPAGLAGSA